MNCNSQKSMTGRGRSVMGNNVSQLQFGPWEANSRSLCILKQTLMCHWDRTQCEGGTFQRVRVDVTTGCRWSFTWCNSVTKNLWFLSLRKRQTRDVEPFKTSELWFSIVNHWPHSNVLNEILTNVPVLSKPYTVSKAKPMISDAKAFTCSVSVQWKPSGGWAGCSKHRSRRAFHRLMWASA